MLNIEKTSLTDRIEYVIPAQGQLANPCYVTVQKTADGSLSINYVMDASYGSITWEQFVTNFESGFNVQVQ